jgi:hypothetical protein
MFRSVCRFHRFRLAETFRSSSVTVIPASQFILFGHVALPAGAALLHRRGQNRPVRPWRQKRENAKAPRNTPRDCAGGDAIAPVLACRSVSTWPPVCPHAHDLGVSWRLGVSPFLPVITEGGWQEMMRQASPNAARSSFECHRVTPRFAASLLGREQTDSALYHFG